MTIRLGLASDLAQLKPLYLAGPHTDSDLRARDFINANSIVVVNVNSGVINACVVVDKLDRGSEHLILYRLVFGASGAAGLTAIRGLLKEIATRGAALGYTAWIAGIPQSSDFATFRAYVEARWPYIEPYDGSGTRYMGDTLANVQVAA